MDDPFPNQIMLKPDQVQQMIGMEKTAFYRFVKNNPAFPKEVVIGKTTGGKPIKRYRKSEVLAYLLLCK